MKLNLLVIRCADIERSRFFYEQLGLRFEKEQHGNGPIHYSSMIAGSVFELYPLKAGEVACNSRLGFTVENIEIVLSRLTPIGTYDFNNKIIYIFQDPDQRKIEISEIGGLESN